MATLMTKDEMRKLYPMVLYEEKHWEVYDEVDARVLAHFFYEEEALAFLEWRNSVSENVILGTIVNEVSEEEVEDVAENG